MAGCSRARDKESKGPAQKPGWFGLFGRRAGLVLLGLALLQPASPWAATAVVTSPLPGSGNTLAAGTGLSAPVSLSADHLSYQEETEYLTARGHVRIWYQDMTLTAEEAEADFSAQLLKARGEVTLIEAGRKLNCAELDYDIGRRSARANGILFSSPPWFYQGKSVEKRGEKEVLISEALFTTCNARHPHYHLTAERIEVILGESLTAYNAVLYVGTTPLFYIPWVYRSIKDRRPPFSLRVGYDSLEGAYAKIRYNYFLWEENYGGVLLDLMEKKGLGTGLIHHFQYTALGKGEGDASVYYSWDRQEERERWTGKMEYHHNFSPEDLLQMNLDYLSDRGFNREYSINLVDSFQQKSSLAYSHRSQSYYLGISAGDVENWDPMLEKYYPVTRDLPVMNYSIFSTKLVNLGPPVYGSFSATAGRHLSRADVYHLENGEVWSDVRFRYYDDLLLSPSLTQTYALPRSIPTQPTISGSLSLPLAAKYYEEVYADLASDNTLLQPDYSASMSTSLTLTNNWVYYRRTKPTHQFQTRLSHNYSRKLPIRPGDRWEIAAITGNQLSLNADYYMGSMMTLRASTGYSLMHQDDNIPWRELAVPLSFSGQATILSRWTVSWQGTHDWKQDHISNGYFSTYTSGKNWNLDLNTSYSYAAQSNPRHVIFGTMGAGYRLLPLGLSMNGSIQYDFMKKNFTNYTLKASSDLHCWEIQGLFKIYADGNSEIGLGLTLKAFPELSMGMGGMGGGVSVGGN